LIRKQGAGKRHVVNRQKIINQVRVQGVQSGMQAQGQGRQRSEPGGLEKQRLRKSRSTVYLTKQDELATDKQRTQV
jgi:hypothetical protein